MGRASGHVVIKSVGSNWVVTLVTIGVTYLLTPFVIRTLGLEVYGTWTLIASLTGFLGLLMLGIPMASVRSFAQHVATGDQKSLNRAIGSCAVLYLVLGLAALLVGAALLAFFVETYTIAPELRGGAYLAFGVSVLYAAAGFVGLLPEGILVAHDEFIRRNVVRVVGVMLRLLLTLSLLTLSPSLVVLALIQLGCLIFDFWASWFLIRRRHPGVRLRLRDCDWGTVRSIVSFSVFVLLLNAGIRLSFETDALVIGAFMHVSDIPYFTVANSLLLYLTEFVVAIAAVVMPTATRLQTQGKHQELGATFLKWSKITLSLTLAAGLFLLLLGPRFIAWWIEPSFEKPAGEVLRVLMLSYFVFLPVRGVALPILLGLGHVRLPTIAFLIAGVMNLGLSILLIRPMGLAGVALGTAIPNVLFALVVLVATCRSLDVPLSSYVRYVVPRAALGALPVAGVLLWFRNSFDVSHVAGLGGAALAMMLVFVVTWVFFVYRHDPYVDLSGRLTRLLARKA